MGFGMGRFAHGWLFPMMGISRLVFAVAVIVLIIYLMRGSARNSVLQPQRGTPLDILKERYAKGEIDAETFEKMKSKLNEA